jgi:hypothetical protein
MFHDQTASEIKAIPTSDKAARKKILEIAAYVTDRVVEKRLQAKQFLPELDESMDT